MGSDCDYTRKHLCAYLGREIEVREGEWISFHLQHCSDCRAAYLQFYNRQDHLRRAMRNWASDSRLPDGWSLDLWSGLMAFCNDAGRRRGLIWRIWASGRRIVRWTAIIAVVIALLIFISPFFFWLANRLPYYGPWASRLVAPVMRTRLDR